MAPEVIAGTNNLSYKIDCWSLGVLMYYMISRDFPYDLLFIDSDKLPPL